MTELLLALGSALLHSVWQGGIAALALLALRPLLRGSRWRYRAAYAALSGSFAAFVGTFVLLLNPVPGTAPMARPVTVDFVPAALYEQALPYLALLWLLGAALLAVRTAGGLLLLRRLRRSGRAAGRGLQARFDALARRAGVAATPLLVGDTLSAPTVLGLLRPAVYLPTSALTGLPPAQLDAILLHELAHIRRLDPLLNLLQIVMETALYHHPATHWFAHEIRTAREHCCDDEAVALCADPLGYARALAQLAAPPNPTALAATGGSLMNRIRRLTAPKPERRAVLPALLALALLLAACSSNGLLRRPAAASTGSYDNLCFSAQVATGSHEIPAFNQASVQAMTRSAGAREIASTAQCGAADVRLDYRMTFDARTLSWQASMTAVDAGGRVVWQGDAADDIPSDGAFQYLTESNAERLLQRFLDGASD